MSKFSIAIVGGGIGGITLAVALSKYPDIHFDIYEAASAFGEIGTGVGIFGRSVSAFTEMGVIDHLDKICTPYASDGVWWTYRKADVLPEGFDLARKRLPAGAHRKGSGSYRRYEFLSLMVSLLPEKVHKGRVHFCKRFTRYEQDADGVTLHFADGTTAKCDLLVGADGIKSPTRLTLYTDLAVVAKEKEKLRMLKYAIPRWSGIVVYRDLISAEAAEKELGYPHRCTKERVTYCGKQAHLAGYPVAGGKMINVSGFVFRHNPDDKTDPVWPAEAPWEERCVSADEMLKAFDGFEDQAMALLKCIKTPSRWAIHELDPLPFYTHQRVALLGDAAHATQPHEGQGANQSIEDAYTLAVILGSSHTTKANIARALKAYERARLSRANDVIRLSAQTARMYRFIKEPGCDNLAAAQAYFEGDVSNWIVLGSPKETAEEAISWMIAGE